MTLSLVQPVRYRLTDEQRAVLLRACAHLTDVHANLRALAPNLQEPWRDGFGFIAARIDGVRLELNRMLSSDSSGEQQSEANGT